MSALSYYNEPAPLAWDVAAAIFGASGLEGVLPDISDLSTLFQTSTGGLPSLPGDPVGLVLDGRKELGPEIVTKPIDLTQSPYVPAVSTLSGNTFTTNNASAGVFWDGKLDLTLREVTVRYSGLTAGIFGVYDAVGSRPVATSNAASGVVRAIYKPAGDDGRIYLRCTNSGQTITIEDFSVREVSGNHLSQPTAAARPTLARMPLTGRRNLLTWTDKFESGWTVSGGTLQNSSEMSPDGISTAVKYVEDGSTGHRNISRSVNFAAVEHTISVYVKAAELSKFFIRMPTSIGLTNAEFDLASGEIISSGLGAAPFISPVGNGWFRCGFAAPANIGGSNVVRIGTAYDGEGSAGSGLFLWGAQIEEGTIATPYQRVTNAFDVTEEGVPDTYDLTYDLTDDALTTTFPTTITGDILIAGRNGSIIEPFSGGTLTIGPDSYTGGTPGILRAIGGIVGVLVIDRSLTQVEKDQLIEYYKGKGAKGLLVPGPELVPGDFSQFADTQAMLDAGWIDTSTGTGQLFLENSRMVCLNTGAGLNTGGSCYPIPLVAGRTYEVRFSLVVAEGGQAKRVNITTNTARPGNGTLLNSTGTATGNFIRAYYPLNTSLYYLHFFNQDTDGVRGEWADISVRELRPQEDWT